MKSILISIKPQHVANILNGVKTLEIRKTMPKCDFPIDVYIYCTKEKQIVFGRKRNIYLCDMRGKTKSGFDFMTLTKNEDTESYINDNINCKIIAKFTLNRIDDLFIYDDELLRKMCLTSYELEHYLNGKNGYAWHIDNLVIFDRPKKLSEFYKFGVSKYAENHAGTEIGYLEFWNTIDDFRLTNPPQSYQFVELIKDIVE